MLPLGAVAFRRGWLLGPILALTLAQGALAPSPAQALTWEDLWQRPDQQAAAALGRGEPERALGLARNPDQLGTASYRLKDYPAAAEAFAAAGGADGDYNRGNALAHAGKLEEAIVAYDQALARQPGMEDALYNRAKVEELLRQQQQEQKQKQKQDQAKSDDQPPQDQQNRKDQGSEGKDQQDGQDDRQQAGGQDQQSGGQDQQAEDQPPGGQEQQAQGKDQASGDPDQQAAEEKQRKGTQDQQESTEQTAQDAAQPQDPSAQQAKEDQAAQDYRRAAAQAGETHTPTEQTDKAAAEADDLTPQEREAQQAAEQWLRRIPDDPAGLLRRKFQYQYRQRAAQQGTVSSGSPW